MMKLSTNVSYDIHNLTAIGYMSYWPLHMHNICKDVYIFVQLYLHVLGL